MTGETHSGRSMSEVSRERPRNSKRVSRPGGEKTKDRVQGNGDGRRDKSELYSMRGRPIFKGSKENLDAFGESFAKDNEQGKHQKKAEEHEEAPPPGSS